MGFLRNLLDGWANMIRPSQFEAWADAVSNQVETLVSGGSEAQLVFRPGEPAPSGNVFASWPALVAAAALIADPKEIVFDDRLAACTIPAGAWNLGDGCIWRGLLPGINSASPNRVQVTCPNGVTLLPNLYELRDIQITYTGAGALMTVPGDGRNRVLYMQRNARTSTTAAGGRIFDVSAGAILNVVMYDLGTIVVAGGGLFVNVLAGATQFALRATESGSTLVRVPPNCFAGPVGPIYQFITDIPGNFTEAQAGMPGGVIPLLINMSPRVVLLADANGAITFGTLAQNANDGGRTTAQMNPTSLRTLTINAPTIVGTELQVVNLGAVDINLTFPTGGPSTTALQSYVKGLGSISLFWNGANWIVISPQTQRGSAALVAGVSPFIPADIVGGDIVTTGLLTWNGVSGILQQFGFVNGTKVGGGGFQLKSVAQASGATVATDAGTYSWMILH